MVKDYNILNTYIKKLKEELSGELIDDPYYRDEIYVFKKKGKIDFYVCFARDERYPRIELQIARPSSDTNNYLIVGEFYEIKETEYEEIQKTIQSILSNSIKITEYYYKEKLVKTEYKYGYYIDDKVEIIKETFTNNIILYYLKKKLVEKSQYFQRWITTEYTIEDGE
ncbi:hypothetical protein Ga0061079_105161 [Apibacter mensalis]|uniref:Uncharacterized protein n=1 Tax=Apibacter mensalis TaxID=1586267 RepID=A0A0X3APC1_9FLAO|nr:hypothetical protein [Apibacter mensalis]CVK16202.1 hypothetical protein Ga0061079_105161 [Apibacter mensalis]